MLAAMLLRPFDMLMLDEPTNHLDFAALAWLESFLADYRDTLLVVSHDRDFLNRIAQAILEIDAAERRINEYTGDYDNYIIEKTNQRRRWEEDYLAQFAELKALRNAIHEKAAKVGHNRAPTDNDKVGYKSHGQRVQGAVERNLRNLDERIRRIEENPVPKPPNVLEVNPRIDPQTLRTQQPISAENLGKSFGGQTIFENVSFSLGPSDRVVITGPNGAGKSTLLHIIAGVLEADAGDIHVNHGVSLALLEQEPALDPHQRVWDYFALESLADTKTLITQVIAFGLAAYPVFEQKFGDLSLGQRRKLQLARLLVERPNALLLDEPTNHMSLTVLEEFEDALLDFPGPVIAVSHDRRFIHKMQPIIWEMRDGSLRIQSEIVL
jgi:macrolide transport system ATP-binding/permease protein